MPRQNVEDILGEQEATVVNNPEENPLEKMDEISKATPDKRNSGSKDLDEDVVKEMLKTGENTDGMFTPKEEEEHQEEDKEAKVKVGKDVKPSEKYEKQFKNDMLKHPNDYKVATPRGEMTIAEAIRAGYNPITKTFDENHGQDRIREKHLSQLNEADRAALENLTNPASAQVAPADAEMYGLQPGSPMIRPEEQAMAGGAMANPAMGAPAPAQAMPQPEAAPAQPDLSALLGGGQ